MTNHAIRHGFFRSHPVVFFHLTIHTSTDDFVKAFSTRWYLVYSSTLECGIRGSLPLVGRKCTEWNAHRQVSTWFSHGPTEKELSHNYADCLSHTNDSESRL